MCWIYVLVSHTLFHIYLASSLTVITVASKRLCRTKNFSALNGLPISISQLLYQMTKTFIWIVLEYIELYLHQKVKTFVASKYNWLVENSAVISPYRSETQRLELQQFGYLTHSDWVSARFDYNGTVSHDNSGESTYLDFRYFIL